jgi:hypothetical protein
MAHSTRSRFGSACGLYCPILFIVTVYKGLHFRKTNAGRVQKCLLRAFSKLHNCIFEFRPIRPCESQVHEDRKSKIANKRSPIWMFPIVPVHSDPVCSKVHTLVAKLHFHNLWLARPAGLKNRHPTTDTDRVFRSRHVACQRRLHRCLRDQ